MSEGSCEERNALVLDTEEEVVGSTKQKDMSSVTVRV